MIEVERDVLSLDDNGIGAISTCELGVDPDYEGEAVWYYEVTITTANKVVKVRETGFNSQDAAGVAANQTTISS